MSTPRILDALVDARSGCPTHRQSELLPAFGGPRLAGIVGIVAKLPMAHVAHALRRSPPTALVAGRDRTALISTRPRAGQRTTAHAAHVSAVKAPMSWRLVGPTTDGSTAHLGSRDHWRGGPQDLSHLDVNP